MRIGKVVGKISLSKAYRSLEGRRWVLVQPQGLAALAGEEAPQREEVVVVDELGPAPGDRVGFSEGMEATFPFQPERVPVDAYLACILDSVDMDKGEAEKLLRSKA